jgi:hypothetical protein
MQPDLPLTVSQQIFILFYAITWGTAANSQPRWRAFAWGAVCKSKEALWRALLSFFLLNVLPLAYFAFVLLLLGSGGWANIEKWDSNAFWKALATTVPALSPFGFYRIWTGIVECRSQFFYGIDWKTWEGERPAALTEFGITLDRSDLNPDFACPNIMFGSAYVVIGFLLAVGIRYF